LPEGEYFHFQLIGMKVLTEDGEYLGRLREILETGSNDVYVVSGDSGELLIPALANVILKVQVTEGVMVVRLMEGLR
jgi:16S rRNA processing protein RimM